MGKSHSIRLAIREEVRKDGTSLLYLSVVINRKVKKIGLGLYWPREYFDHSTQTLKARDRKDSDVKDYTMIIEAEKGKVNEIFKLYRLRGVELTKETFEKEYFAYSSRQDFIEYFRTKARERNKRKVITYETYASAMVTWRKLKEYRSVLPFSELTSEFLEDFESYCRSKLKNGRNTIWKNIKDIRTYSRLAESDGIVFEDPFKNYSITPQMGTRESLTSEELKKLIEVYESDESPINYKQAIYYYLESFFLAGMRISDLARLKKVGKITSERVWIKPRKTLRFDKELSIPLNDWAKRLLKEDIPKLTDQATNRVLKRIMENLGIEKNITLHTARHTFATLFLESGGKVEVLKELLGHSDIKNTMVYVHITEARKKEQMDSFMKGF